MKKTAIAFLILFSGNFALATGQSKLCTRWYSYDIFQTYLRITVSLPDAYSPVSAIWVDTHIPYGIRPLPYEISTLECTAHGLHIIGSAPTNTVEFIFKGVEGGPDIQNGTLSYLDNSGNPVNTINYECSASAVKDFCALPK